MTRRNRTIHPWKALAVLGLLLLGSSCGDVGDDLFPSGQDKRPGSEENVPGNRPGQIMVDFSLPSTEDGTFTLADYLAGGAQPSDALVFYFTMWCPICTADQDRMLFDIMPLVEGRGTVRWILVDYVSGSVSVARAAQRDSGFAGTSFIVLVDEVQQLQKQLDAAMSTTIVVDGSGVILMNETFRDGQGIADALDRVLPPR